MKKIVALLLSTLLLGAAVIPMSLTASAANAAPTVLPAIRHWEGGSGSFTPNSSTILVSKASSAAKQIELVQGFFKDMLGLNLTVATGGTSNAIIFTIDSSILSSVGEEGYILTANTSKIEIKAPTEIGLLYGGITVVQSVYADGYFPCGTATDYPAYSVRSGMIDVARAYVPMSELREITKYMAWYKMNQIQVHLNDDGDNNYTPFRLESDLKGLTAKDGFYTKDEYRQYQKDMLEYGVTVISEIDTPYHSSCFSQLTEDPIKYISGTHNTLDLTDEATKNTIKKLFTEYLSGDDPVIVNKTIHIGMDEYPAGMESIIGAYCNEMIAHVNSYGYKARFWSGQSSIHGCLYGNEIKGDFEVNYWATDYSGTSETLALNCDIINTHNNTLYVVPSGNYGFDDYYDLEDLYSNWQVNQYYWGGTQTLCDADDSRLKGACFAIWNDIHTSYFGLTYRDVLDRVRGMTCLMAEKTWCGTDTASKISTADFIARYNTLSVRAGDADPFCTSLPDEGITLDFASSKAPEGVTYNGCVPNGQLVLDGGSSVSFDCKAVGFPNTLSFDLTLAEYPEEQTALFAGYDTIGSEIFIDTDGTLGFKSKISETDCYTFTFGYQIPLNKKVNLCLTSDIKNTVLIVDKTTAYDTLNDHLSLVPSDTNTTIVGKRWSTLFIPLVKIGEGIRGVMDNLTIKETSTSTENLRGSDNLSLNKNVTVSGTEVDYAMGPECAVDGSMETRLSFSRDSDDQWLIVDLGATYSISSIVIEFYQRISSYSIWVSETGNANDYKQVYIVSGLEDGSAATEVISLDEAVNARFVKYQQLDRFTVDGYESWGEYSGGISEFRVYSAESEKYINAISDAKNLLSTLSKNNSYYKDIKTYAYGFDSYLKSGPYLSTTAEIFYNELQYAVELVSTKDINVSNNVALGKPYTHTDLYQQGGKEDNWGWNDTVPVTYPDEKGVSLTDGAIANDDSYRNIAWAGFHYKTPQYIEDGYNYITVDLQGAYDITQCRLYVGTKALGESEGFSAPDAVEFFVSEDGIEFVSVGKASYSDSGTNVTAVATLNCNVKANYVQARFTGDAWMFVSEIAVVGTAVKSEDDNQGGDTDGDNDNNNNQGGNTENGGNPPSENPPVEDEYVKGDINDNGSVDMTDYILAKRAYFGTYTLNEGELKRGDVNESANMDMTDYILIKRVYFGTYSF